MICASTTTLNITKKICCPKTEMHLSWIRSYPKFNYLYYTFPIAHDCKTHSLIITRVVFNTVHNNCPIGNVESQSNSVRSWTCPFWISWQTDWSFLSCFPLIDFPHVVLLDLCWPSPIIGISWVSWCWLLSVIIVLHDRVFGLTGDNYPS